MRYLLLLALAIIAALYFTTGLRLGRPDLSETFLLDANGKNTYQYRTLEDDKHVRLQGICDVRTGKVTLRFLDAQGEQLAGQECSRPGTYSLNLSGGGKAGAYILAIDYQKFTGHLKLDESRYSAN